MNNIEKINKLCQQIEELPVGYISKKNINGKVCHYRQWKENGKVRSKYIPAHDVDQIASLIDKRNRLKAELKLEQLRPDNSNGSLDRFYNYAHSYYMGGRVSIGTQNYEELISNRLFYIDKTKFIKEWWEKGDEVSLITRPRRFGKTLNLSMLYYFFSNKYAGRSDLFDSQFIWQFSEYRELQGTYPVIFLSFGAVKLNTADGIKAQIALQIQSFIWSLQYLADQKLLTPEELSLYNRYSVNLSPEEAVPAISFVCKLLYRIYSRKIIILLDEYDTPMLEAWTSGIWAECNHYLRNIFNALFKTNAYLQKGLLTGITRISKESFFSDMNNVRVYSSTSSEYATCFGFTEEEVFAALDAQHIDEKEKVKEWYDGFSFGRFQDIYNPWSITNYLRDRKFEPYWAHSASNRLLNDIFKPGNTKRKIELSDLISGETIITPLNEDIAFNELDFHKEAVWSLLLASGYLKVVNRSADGRYELAITNKEVKIILEEMVRCWASDADGYDGFLEALQCDDVDYLNLYMNSITQDVFSYFDVSGKEPERFYHGFVLGMIIDLRDKYVITSNRESGLGRFDVVMEPVNPRTHHAIILEFKVHRPSTENSLEDTAANALLQIAGKKYDSLLLSHGISADNIYSYGIAFSGKKVLIRGGLLGIGK